VGPISIRFERFTVFHTSTSGGGHDLSTRMVISTLSNSRNFILVMFSPPMISALGLPVLKSLFPFKEFSWTKGPAKEDIPPFGGMVGRLLKNPFHIILQKCKGEVLE
jgi:hypothetical protein